MEKNDIYIITGKQYLEMTKTLLRECRLSSLIGEKSALVGIKPNLVAPSPAFLGATTHPEVVAGLIEYLQEEGFYNLVILEGSWVGDETKEAFEVCGYEELSERYSVPLVDMQKEPAVEVIGAGMKLFVGRAALSVNFLINCPVLKGHCQTRVTCALKNMKGLLPNQEKRRFHALGLHSPIAHLSAALPQSFVLVDNLCSDLDFEDGGNPVEMNRLMAGRDPVLMDAYAASLLHYEAEEVEYIRLAGELGVGCPHVQEAQLHFLGEERPKELPLSRKVVAIEDAVEQVDSCSACYGTLIPALEALGLGEAQDLVEALGGRICIGQGFRGKTGKIGVGNCTRRFEKNLPGCPPEPEEIEEFLRDILQERGLSVGRRT